MRYIDTKIILKASSLVASNNIFYTYARQKIIVMLVLSAYNKLLSLTDINIQRHVTLQQITSTYQNRREVYFRLNMRVFLYDGKLRLKIFLNC